MRNAYIAKKGFTLLFATLIASILLAIGLAIFNIVIKELELSAGARDSVFAFYAADTGVECALYHDFQNDVFSISSPAYESPPFTSSISCAGAIQTVTGVNNVGAGIYTRSFSIDLSPEPYCAEVEVTKYTSPVKTILISHGLSTCDTSSPRRAQRTLRVTY